MAQPRKQQRFTYLEPHSGGTDDAAASLLLETELSNLSLCGGLPPHGARASALVANSLIPRTKALVHIACKAMILLIAA